MSDVAPQADAVRIEKIGAIGQLVLARPANLNSLDAGMIAQLHAGLKHYEADPTVKLIMIRSDSDRAFCAGGNMKLIHQQCRAGDFATVETFFRQEYALNLAIARCSKPYLAVIDGIAMGGGLGISVHGRFRVVTERALLAMPETRIGFFPDVGATCFLPRLPWNCGLWLALTAASVKGAEAVHTGLATHFIHSSDIDKLMTRLTEASNNDASFEQILDELSDTVEKAEFQNVLRQRAAWFCDNDIDTIRTRLRSAAADSDDAQKLLNLLDQASPFSIDLTLRLFAQAARTTEATNGGVEINSLRRCLENEFVATAEALRHPDFMEGVRAVLVDKDHKPRWLRK